MLARLATFGVDRREKPTLAGSSPIGGEGFKSWRDDNTAYGCSRRSQASYAKRPCVEQPRLCQDVEHRVCAATGVLNCASLQPPETL